MSDIDGFLARLRRPRLLIRAARIGARDYRRDAHLPRALGEAPPAQRSAALQRLVQIEAELDARRKARDAGYSVVRHVAVLAALLAEARMTREAA